MLHVSNFTAPPLPPRPGDKDDKPLPRLPEENNNDDSSSDEELEAAKDISTPLVVVPGSHFEMVENQANGEAEMAAAAAAAGEPTSPTSRWAEEVPAAGQCYVKCTINNRNITYTCKF